MDLAAVSYETLGAGFEKARKSGNDKALLIYERLIHDKLELDTACARERLINLLPEGIYKDELAGMQIRVGTAQKSTLDTDAILGSLTDSEVRASYKASEALLKNVLDAQRFTDIVLVNKKFGDKVKTLKVEVLKPKRS